MLSREHISFEFFVSKNLREIATHCADSKLARMPKDETVDDGRCARVKTTLSTAISTVHRSSALTHLNSGRVLGELCLPPLFFITSRRRQQLEVESEGLTSPPSSPTRR